MPQFHNSARIWPTFLLTVLLAAASVMLAAPAAEAQQRYSYNDGGFFGWFQQPYRLYQPRQQRERRPERRPVERRHPLERAPDESKAAEGKKPSGPLYAVVSLADQHVSFYDANGLWERSTISTGVEGHTTPSGIFSILEKERWHRSNIYSGAPMPYMQRLTWTGVAMHEGYVTGRPASHGCVRLPGAFAKRLFGLTSVGQRVIISPEDVTPKDIVNAHLPVPDMLTPPQRLDDKIAVKEDKALEAVALDKTQTPQNGDENRLNPAAFAKALKAAAMANAKAAAQAKKTALAAVAGKSDEVRQASLAVPLAEDGVRKANAERDAASAALEKAQGDDAIRSTTDRKAAADAKAAEAERQLSDASDAETAKQKELSEAKDAVREAEEQAEAAVASAKEAAMREQPLSIFISRKTKHLYVRQATETLFDMPITIRDPDRPLGTHLFIATRAGQDGASLHWVGLTPPAAVEIKRHRRATRKGRNVEAEEEAAPKPFPETAQVALDRIEFPPEALHRIAERLWVGATLIVSDVEKSGEGRYAMDFMILNRTIARDD